MTPNRLTILALVAGASLLALAWGRVSHRVDAGYSRVASTRAPQQPGPAPRSLEAGPASRRVFDPHAGLGHFRGTIIRQADRWYEDLGIDFHVVILRDGKRPIEELTDELFHRRAVGKDAPTGGLILVVDAAANAAHLQPAYELEPALPDAILGRVVREQLAPYASYSILGMAVMDVLHVLKDVAFLRAAEGHLDLAAEYKARAAYGQAQRYLAGGGGALARWSEVPIDADLKARIPAPKRARYAPSADPMKSAEAFLRVLGDLAGDPSLDLFTAGSRVQRARYPFAVFEQLKHLESLEASRPLTLARRNDRAVVGSETPTNDFLPILLHRVDGLWRVDLVETYKNLGSSTSGRWIETNSNSPYHFWTRRMGPGVPQDEAALDLGGVDVAVLLDRLDEQEGPLFRYMAGELLFRNCFVFPEAIAEYEQAVALAPDAPAFARVLADRAESVGFLELAIDAYARLGKTGRLDRAILLARVGRTAEAIDLAQQVLDDDPYDVRALSHLARWVREADPALAFALEQRRADVLGDPGDRYSPLGVDFDPPRPVLSLGGEAQPGGRLLYDSTDFSVRFENPTGGPIEIQEVTVTASGTDGRERLGDLVGQLSYASVPGILGPGETATLTRKWGFDEETAHQQVSYVFDYCWKGEGNDLRRCRTAHVHAFPR